MKSFQARCILDYHAGITKGKVYTVVNVFTVKNVFGIPNVTDKLKIQLGEILIGGEKYVVLSDNIKYISVPANCFKKI